LHPDRVAHLDRALHVHLDLEEGEAGAIHGRQRQAFGQGHDHDGGHGPPLDREPLAVVQVGEELFGEPDEVDVAGEVDFEDRAAGGVPLRAELQLFEEQTAGEASEVFHDQLSSVIPAASTALR
jgi:hypothetical protein